MRLSTLIKLAISYSKGHPLQKFLLFLGISIGVAVVVSVDLANNSIGRSFQLSTKSITGRATHQIVGPSAGLDQKVYVDLRKTHKKKAAPVVTDYVRIKRMDNRMMHLLGIDAFVDSEFRAYLGNEKGFVDENLLASLLTEPDLVLLSKDIANQFQIKKGEQIQLKTSKGIRNVTIAALLDSSDNFTKQAISGVILSDISTAQEILQMENRISYIDLILDEKTPTSLESLQTSLPEGYKVVSLDKNQETVREMSKSFEMNLRALSLLALLVGMFLIYNTVTFSVIQRRFQLGTLRALGTTKREIFSLIITETLFWGLLGSIAGLLLGVALGTGIVKLVSQTISDLYFALTVNVFHLEILGLIKAFSLGMAASLISAFFPAWESANISPVEALRRSSLEKKISSNLLLLTFGGSVLMGLGAFLTWIPTRNLLISFAALLFIVFGAAMMVPLTTKFLLRLAQLFLQKVSGVTVRMATRNISRSLSRTGIAVASLMIAVSVIVGVGTMVGSFRSTVVDWLSSTIRADLYIRPANDLVRELKADFKDKLLAIKGVKSVYTIQTQRIQTGRYTNSTIVSLNKDTAQRKWLWRVADEKQLESLFNQGWVFVSETFAWKYQVQGQTGETLLLLTEQGPQKFKIGGIFRDFSSEQGIIVLSENTYQRFWKDRSLFGISLFVKEGASVETIRQQIEKEYGEQYNLLIRSNQGLRNAAIEVFDRTFTITIALQILAGVVAFIGVLSTVMSLMMERSREIGVLRANGLTIRQLWKLVLTESGLIGLIAGLFAIPLGTAMAWILVFVINKRSFGWTLDFVLQTDSYVQAITIAISSAILAGIYPIVAITKKPVAELLRTE